MYKNQIFWQKLEHWKSSQRWRHSGRQDKLKIDEKTSAYMQFYMKIKRLLKLFIIIYTLFWKEIIASDTSAIIIRAECECRRSEFNIVWTCPEFEIGLNFDRGPSGFPFTFFRTDDRPDVSCPRIWGLLTEHWRHLDIAIICRSEINLTCVDCMMVSAADSDFVWRI